jgi:thiamine monophosphate synthase
MNERIKQLAQQCWDKRLDGLHFDQEKFAELIVRECCQQRQWIGLTMLEMSELRQGGFHNITDERFRAIEAKLKEKNT